jgi:hypothetical protein
MSEERITFSNTGKSGQLVVPDRRAVDVGRSGAVMNMAGENKYVKSSRGDCQRDDLKHFVKLERRRIHAAILVSQRPRDNQN